MSWKKIIAIIAAVVLGVPLLAALGVAGLVALFVLAVRSIEPGYGSQFAFHIDPTPQWSPDGSSIVFGHHDGKIYVVDSDGSSLRSISEGSGIYDLDFSPSISPDGSLIAYTTLRHATGGVRDLEIVTSTLDGSERRRLTENKTTDISPVWSPDGDQLAFVSASSWWQGERILVMSPDGSNIRHIVSSSDIMAGISTVAPEWSPDGQSLAFVAIGDSYGSNVSYVVGLDGSGLTSLGETISQPAWLPSGQRIVFTKIKDKFADLYTANADGSELRELSSHIARSPHHAKIELESLMRNTISMSPDGSETILMGQYVIRWDALGFVLISIPSPGFASWSPDGSRIAITTTADTWIEIYPDSPSFGRAPGPPGAVLYTVDADGTNARALVVQDGNGNLLPANGRPLDDGQSATTIYFDGAGPPPAPFDIEQCSNGVVFPNPDVNPRVVEDCETLLQIRDSLGANPPLNWNTDTIIFNWEGIVLGNAGVGSLRLPDRDLTGVISSEFGKLSGLTELDLSENWLGGKIPSDLGNLTNLEKLNLSRNGLSGKIPSDLGNLTNLEKLNLSRNGLSGKIPSDLGNLTNLQTNLQELDLSYNNLSGSLSPDLFPSYGNFLLELSGNSLEGCVPRSSLLYGPKRYPYYDSPLEYCED